MLRRAVPIFLIVSLNAACVSYKYAENVKMLSFEETVDGAKSVGPVEGRDCVWSLFGYALGGGLTIDRAFANARSQSSTGIQTAFVGGNDSLTANSIKYLNNVSTSYDGFNAVVIGKNCLVVKGLGLR